MNHHQAHLPAPTQTVGTSSLIEKKKHNRPLKKLKLSLCVPCVSVIQVKTLLFVVFGSSCCFLVTLKQVGRKKHVVAILGNCLKKDQQEWTKESFLFLERRDLFVADNSFASRHTNAHIYTYLTHKNTSRKILRKSKQHSSAHSYVHSML